MFERAVFEGMPRAPKFPSGLTWLNIDHPLQFGDELAGRVVVLDFWTYCCINCLHILPDLAALEEKYHGAPVVFLGVHSHKYPHEADPRNIREAILRHHIHHPVVVDREHQVWDSFAVHAWPTLVVVDPSGYVAAVYAGEGHREELDTVIAALLERGRAQQTLIEGPLPTRLEIPHLVISPLSFPSKVLADRAGGRLFIADSAHNRILITDWQGNILGFFGSGQRGMVDGTYEDVRFNNPQGMLLLDHHLYLADTDNHMLRRADLRNYHVDTVLGNGVISYDRRGGKTGRAQGLNSPWDLAWLDGRLYIAMAGLHQIWTFDPATGIAQAAIGTGRENITDGQAHRAALAQPSGLSVAKGMLYCADAETSAVRRFNPTTGEVTRLVGEGLFTFGDVDGLLDGALLQHPLGVAAQEDEVFVADTYNHKIKRIDLHTGRIDTIAGTGHPGREADGHLALYEPGGLAVAGNDLFIADTNNDRIIHLRLDTGEWHAVVLKINGQPLE